MRSPADERRPYRMRRRAASVDATRRRITEAAVRLHTTIGPSRASLSAIAEAAGVTRVTLYHHFRDADELFAACMGHWRALHPPPDPTAWTSLEAFEPRLRRAIGELYDWYRANADDLYPIYRDAAHTPASNRARRRATNEQAADAILAGLRIAAGERRRVRAAVLHVVGFWTWRSLSVEGGLAPVEAVETALGFVLSVRSGRHRRRDPGRHPYHPPMTDAERIDAYLAKLPAEQRALLEHVRGVIARVIPEAVETISYGMPTFKLRGKGVMSYAGWKAHASLYPVTDTFLSAHAEALAGYDRTKGSVHFSAEHPLPDEVIEELVRARVADLEGGGR